MGLNKQQKQTKKYFGRVSVQWYNQAHKKSDKVLNVIQQRNIHVINTAKKLLSKKKRILDVGCGTGELVIDLLKLGFKAEGIDFAKSMIKKAQQQAIKNKFEKNVFIYDSFFDHSFNNKYDLISANGFIEYISEEQLTQFLKISSKLLSKNGILIINSRNRLFNVFSYNDFTKQEIKNKTIIPLIEECVLFNSGKSLVTILKNKKSMIKSNLKKHKKTIVEVETRLQYTPIQICQKLEKNLFKPFDILPIHIHVFTTESRKELPNFHNQVSNFVQNKNIKKITFLPQSSSFMVSARKK